MATLKEINESLDSKISESKGAARLSFFSLLALGVVFGDIGTSPLYAIRYCFFDVQQFKPSHSNVLGILSLIAWSLIIVISIKYLIFILRASDKSEGGILILMELAKRPLSGLSQKTVLGMGLFGSALLYSDGMITPAISIVSSIEGLEVATKAFHPYIIYIAIVIVIGLFILEQSGTSGVGKLFGPIMMIWFITIAVTGLISIFYSPEILLAFIPSYGIKFFLNNGLEAFTILGIVFLAVTGGEALYADIGHFGVTPIRFAWYCLVFPSLLLNYFGQGRITSERNKWNFQSFLSDDPFLDTLSVSSSFHSSGNYRVPGRDFRGIFTHIPVVGTRISSTPENSSHICYAKRPDLCTAC